MSTVTEAFLARLEALAKSELGGVFKTIDRRRVDARAAAELPALEIERADGSAQIWGQGACVLTQLFDVSFLVVESQQLETELDALHEQLHRVMLPDPDLEKLGKKLTLDRCGRPEVFAGDVNYARMTATYSVAIPYRTADIARAVS